MRRLIFFLFALTGIFIAALIPISSQEALPLSTISPRPGQINTTPLTSIAITQADPLNTAVLPDNLFTVTGSKSGSHPGSVRFSDDRRSVFFYPDHPFAYDETVSVVVQPGLRSESGARMGGARYEFSTLARYYSVDDLFPTAVNPNNIILSAPQSVLEKTQIVTHPEFANTMPVAVNVPAQAAADGYLFITGVGFLFPTDPTLMIVDNDAEPIFIWRIQKGLNVTDFKIQMVNGTPFLVFHAGVPTRGWSSGVYYVLDQNYRIVDKWTINNGYGADEHELQLLDNGHALMLSYVPVPYDLSPYGGPEDGIVIDLVIQEQDASKNVIFEWRALDHIPVTDTRIPLDISPVDYVHGNAIEVDYDGHLLISSRHISEITKIQRQTGEIIWRLGGKSNQFTFTNDIGFSFQHDIRRLANGDITLFDNGNQRNPPFSRAVQYEINEAQRTVTRVWQYPADANIYAQYMGSMQRLDNGSTVISWGNNPIVNEIRPDGSKAFELQMDGLTYRAFRSPWQGFPAAAPRLIVAPSPDTSTANLYFSWNGATEVQAYEVYAGADAASLTWVIDLEPTGFETSATLAGFAPGTCVFQVRPVHASGQETPFSNLAYRLDLPECAEQMPERLYLPSLFRPLP